MNIQPTKILILGISGMLGNALFRFFSANPNFETYGSVRSTSARIFFPQSNQRKIVDKIEVENIDSLIKLFDLVQPDVVINCIGVIKQLAEADDPLISIPINALLPHRLACLCELNNTRLIHMSSDCVFSGKQGNYQESDIPDAIDLYGRSKLLGEVEYPHVITLRTSIIGKELNGSRSLIGWFLEQKDVVKGYRKVIFSGLPTIEIAKIICEFILPNPHLNGLYHLSVDPISKYDLLLLVAKIYQKNIVIDPDEQIVIDRSLNSNRFRDATGFKPKPWIDLIQSMHDFELNREGI
jgi:dTDP-4-dehydrorhamnose reductase